MKVKAGTVKMQNKRYETKILCKSGVNEVHGVYRPKGHAHIVKHSLALHSGIMRPPCLPLPLLHHQVHHLREGMGYVATRL